MSRRMLTFMAMWPLLAAPSAVLAQTSTSANVPVLSSGQMPNSAPTADEPFTNEFKLSATAGTHFDDNAVLGAAPRRWDLGYFVHPQIAFTETLPRLNWEVDYAPGVDISQNVFYRNLFSQKLNGNVSWLVSPHGVLSGQEYFIVTTDPFAQLGGTASPGPTVSPNQGPFIPNVRRTQTLSNALYSYQFSEHSSFGIGGNFVESKFDSTPKHGPTTALIYSRRAAGQAYFQHQFSARNGLGLQYNIQDLRFPRFDARTRTHTILIFDQITISPNSTFTIYGGPEYSDTSNQVQLSLGFIIITIPVKANAWSGAGGVIYNWAGNRLGMSLNFTRGVSDGGGLVGAVELNSGSAKFTWRLSRRWSLLSELSGSNDTLLASKTQDQLMTYSVRAGFTQQLWRDLSMDWYYERLNQTGGFASFPIGNHDFAGASLTYTLLKPVGR